MTAHGPSTGRIVETHAKCWSCGVHQPFLRVSEGRLHVSFQGRAAEALTDASPESAQEILDRLLRVVGSSSTTSGSTRSRGTFGIGSSPLVCRRLRRTRSVRSSTSAPSISGTDGGRTSASSKPSWSVMVGTIGTVPGAESGPMGPELEETS